MKLTRMRFIMTGNKFVKFHFLCDNWQWKLAVAKYHIIYLTWEHCCSSADIVTVIISLYSGVHMKEAYVNRDKKYGYVIMKLYTGIMVCMHKHNLKAQIYGGINWWFSVWEAVKGLITLSQ